MQNVTDVFSGVWWTYSSAHLIAHTKVESTLLIHGVIDSREFRELGPLVFKRIIQQTVVRAGGNTKEMK